IFEDPNIYKGKTITKRILDKKKSDLYYNMSAVFNTLKNLQKADEYIDKAIALAKSYDNTIMVANYMQLKADNFYENGQTERALRIRLEYLPTLEKSTVWKSNLQGTYQNIAQEYFKLDKMEDRK